MNEIIKDARKLYHQTIKDPAYAKSHIWNDGSENYQNLMRIINTCETPEAVEEELRKTDMYAIRIHDQRTFDLMMQWHKINIPHGFTIDAEVVNTPNLLKMVAYCEDIYSYCGSPNTIVELGGGNGQFAYIAEKCFHNNLHIDIDIPETLYMAYVCTRARFPNAKCHWVSNEESGIDLMPDAQFFFCPVNKAEILKGHTFDLFVNTASMGELPNETIRYWMDFVQNKINIKYFFGFNRFLNTIYPDASNGYSAFRKNENEASVLFDDRWHVLKWEVEPYFAQCPYEDPKIARYLEIILQRRETGDILDRSLLDKVEMEDWWRYRGQDPIGTHRSNQLVNDYTINGTLFKLWNAMRLNPRKETAEMMLQYLKHIGRTGTIFEEELFYKKQL